MARHSTREAARAQARLLRLQPLEPALVRFEAAYARGEDGAAFEPSVLDHPYPAAVRARGLAIRLALGELVSSDELAYCARSCGLQRESHLLGNHVLEDSIGLACAAAVTSGTEAEAWAALAERRLDRELQQQFLPDGGHFERSATYHGWLLCGLLELGLLRTLFSQPVENDRFISTVRRGLSWIRRVRTPDGAWPLFSDASLDFCPTPDELLALGAALDLMPEPTNPTTLDWLRDTGWLIARVGRATLFIDVAPVGPDHIPAHGHADALSFELWIDRERVVVDAGVAGYGVGDARAWTRATSSHNTLTIDNLDSAEMWASFRVGRRGNARTIEAVSTESYVRVVAQHDGYASCPGAPRHTRTFELTESALDLLDQVSGAGSHSIASNIRLDSRATSLVEVDGQPTFTQRPSRWYPSHAQSLPAVQLHSEVTTTLPAALRARLGFAAVRR